MRTNTEIARSLLKTRRTNIRREDRRVYLNCTFADKDKVKALGAIWDNLLRKWYIEEWADKSPFWKWLNHGVETTLPKTDAAKEPDTGLWNGLYLAKKKSKVVHLWTGSDTVCRMHSTGGMSKHRKHILTSTNGKSICVMCSQSFQKRRADAKIAPVKNMPVIPDDVDDSYVRLLTL